jgi:hypothetical protein
MATHLGGDPWHVIGKHYRTASGVATLLRAAPADLSDALSRKPKHARTTRGAATFGLLVVLTLASTLVALRLRRHSRPPTP